ncbi:hypothetical protein KY347_00710 [Candidatus Woesearchaeota archaeon]|nr:hypothetical protein [Candidatus Woesearchaeota archaeon]
MDRKVLVLDFDGVICDSLNECMLSSYNAYLKIKGLNRIKDLNEIDSEKKKEFSGLRPFLREGKDYVLFFWIIENKIAVRTQKDFDRVRAQQEHDLPLYEQEFYKEREFLLSCNKEKWLSLNPLYTKDFFREINNFVNVFILTTKRKEYVIEILDYHRISFPEENVIYTEAQDKIKNLLDLVKKKDLLPDKCAFVEDQVEFLTEAKNFNINVFLAGWSYASEEQKEKARKNSIKVINKKDFERVMKEFGC